MLWRLELIGCATMIWLCRGISTEFMANFNRNELNCSGNVEAVPNLAVAEGPPRGARNHEACLHPFSWTRTSVDLILNPLIDSKGNATCDRCQTGVLVNCTVLCISVVQATECCPGLHGLKIFDPDGYWIAVVRSNQNQTSWSKACRLILLNLKL